MKKKLVVIIVSFIITLALVIGAIFIYMQIDKSKKEKKKIEDNIVSNYETFANKYTEIIEERKVYSLEVANDIVEENLENYDKWIEEINKYTLTVESIENVSTYLKENCIDKEYKKQDIKNKCDSFIIDYETAYNYYIKDVNSFNNSIKNITITSDKEYNEYELKYNYVDINKDGKFFGKD